MGALTPRGGPDGNRPKGSLGTLTSVILTDWEDVQRPSQCFWMPSMTLGEAEQFSAYRGAVGSSTHPELH